MKFKEDSAIKVSVIVPVWNPGPGISRCMESLQNQTLKEIEMIFVDDCGTDDSMDKVRAAATNDPRIRMIVNERKIGAGLSRNRGIQEARGEYLSFVDSDDCVAADFLQLLYQEAAKQSFDIVKGSSLQKKEDGSFERDSITNQLIRYGLAAGKPLYTLFKGEHWSAIYRKEFLHGKKIRYGMSSQGEDTTFTLQACSQAASFSLVDEACYIYYINTNSTSFKRDESYLDGKLKSLSEKVDYVLSKLPDDNDSREYLSTRFHYALDDGGRFINEPDMKHAIAEYTKGIRKELLRLPCCEALTGKDFSLYALQKHGILLPKKALPLVNEGFDNPVRHAKLVEKWVDFLLSYPNDARACWKELKPLIIRVNKIVENQTSCFEERKQGRKLLNEQVKRLSPKHRMQLKLLETKAAFKRLKR